MAAKKQAPQTVIVTTEHRGVFVGQMTAPNPGITEATLDDAIMIIYWGTERGLGQLAAEGPTAKTRLSSKVPRWHLRKITSVLECSDAAAKAFAERAK